MTNPNPDNQDFVRGWRADEPLLNPPLEPVVNLPLEHQELETEGSTARFEKQLGGRWSTEGMVRTMIVSAIWKQDSVLRNEAIETAKDRYPMPTDTPEWLAKAYEKAWRQTGKELIRSAVFGLSSEAEGITPEQQREYEDQRRKELLAYHFMIPSNIKAGWRTEQKRIEKQEHQVAESRLELQETDTADPAEEQRLNDLETKLTERRKTLTQRQAMRVRAILNRDAQHLTSTELANQLTEKLNKLLEDLNNPAITAGMSATDIEKNKETAKWMLGQASECQGRAVSINAFKKVWEELDKGALEDYRDQLRTKLIDKLTGKDFWQTMGGSNYELSRQLREKFLGKWKELEEWKKEKISPTVNVTSGEWEPEGGLDTSETLAVKIRKQREELNKLYAEQDKKIEQAQSNFEAQEKAKVAAEEAQRKAREEARNPKKKKAA